MEETYPEKSFLHCLMKPRFEHFIYEQIIPIHPSPLPLKIQCESD